MSQSSEIEAAGAVESGEKPVLEIKDLRVNFQTYAGVVKALDGVMLRVGKGEALGLVGESGCGKSVTAATVEGLLPDNASVVGGQILLNGVDLLKKTKKQMRDVRVNDVAIVFQDPMTFLNPVLTIGTQISEVFDMEEEVVDREAAKILQEEGHASTNETSQNASVGAKRGKPKRALRKKALRRLSVEAMTKVGLTDPERLFDEYPHELSGGMRQRAMIAMAIARNPVVFMADEITTALDVTMQAQILDLLRTLRREFESSILIITHDMGVVASICDRVAVMYAGSVVETAEIHEIFNKPLHPYTQGLLKAIPHVVKENETLDSVPGSVPDLIYPPSGCRFHPRCSYAWDLCQQQKPPHIETQPGHWVECHLYKEEKKSDR
ncbi:MAG: ABC transporter ATP-binding protein [Nitrososphaerales archaeon]